MQSKQKIASSKKFGCLSKTVIMTRAHLQVSIQDVLPRMSVGINKLHDCNFNKSDLMFIYWRDDVISGE